jgi:hypothetical protein
MAFGKEGDILRIAVELLENSLSRNGKQPYCRGMSEREYSLPAGYSDVGEFLEREAKRASQQYDLFRSLLRQNGWKDSAQLFDLLAQRIDSDLLYTEEQELILPKVQELALKECEKVIPTLHGHLQITNKVKKSISRILDESHIAPNLPTSPPLSRRQTRRLSRFTFISFDRDQPSGVRKSLGRDTGDRTAKRSFASKCVPKYNLGMRKN